MIGVSLGVTDDSRRNVSASVLVLGGKRVIVRKDAPICPHVYTRRDRRNVCGDLQISLKSLFGDIWGKNAA